MIVFWIVFAFVLLILSILFMPIHLICRYPAKSNFSFRILCFRFDGVELFKKIFTKNEAKDTDPKTVQKGKKNDRSADLFGFLEFLLHLTDVIRSTILEFFSKAKVNLKELRISVGTDDAARTALLSCSVTQAANGLCAALQHFSKFRCNSKKLSIAPDFTSEKSDFSLHLDISCTVIHMIRVYLHANMRFFE